MTTQGKPCEGCEPSQGHFPQADQKFEALLEYIQRSRGFDFTGYKRPSLMRRVFKRMQMVGLADFEAYMDYLEVHPDEFAQLFNMTQASKIPSDGLP